MNTASATTANKTDNARGTTTAVMLKPAMSSKDKLVKQNCLLLRTGHEMKVL